MLNTDTKGFMIENLAEFNREVQPSIPKEFPHNKLPSKSHQLSIANSLDIGAFLELGASFALVA